MAQPRILGQPAELSDRNVAIKATSRLRREESRCGRLTEPRYRSSGTLRVSMRAAVWENAGRRDTPCYDAAEAACCDCKTAQDAVIRVQKKFLKKARDTPFVWVSFAMMGAEREAMCVDVFCTVDGQRLKIETPIRHFPRSSEDFVRFLFSFSEDWDGLLIFAQFRQFGRYSNQYLETVTVDGVSYQAATLPGWPKPGPLTLLLYGTGNETVIGTTNAVLMHIDATGLIDEADVSDMDETLYQQLVNRVIGMENVLRLNAKCANTYHCVEDMQGDMELTDGMVARTVSYYRDNNLGGADYNISATAEVGAVALANGLYANIRGDKVYPEQFGAYRDGETDDTEAIQTAINTGKTVGLSRGAYYVDGGTEEEAAITIHNGAVIIGDDMQESILRIDSDYGIKINSGRDYGTGLYPTVENWPKATLSNIHFIGNGENTCLHVLRSLTYTGETKSDYWGASFNLEHFQIRNFACPFRILSAFQTVIRDGFVYECGTGVFSYYDEALETYPVTKFSDQNLFDSVFFLRKRPSSGENPLRSLPFLELTNTCSFTFLNCSFEYAVYAFHSTGYGREVRCIGCWFERIDYVYHLDNNADSTRLYELIDCHYDNVLGYKDTGRNVDASFEKHSNILIKEKSSSTATDLIHGYNGGSVFLMRAPNEDDLIEKWFTPYDITTRSAKIKMPLNIISAETYRDAGGGKTASLNLSTEPFADTRNVGCRYSLLVDVYNADNHYYIAEYLIYKRLSNYYVSEPRIIAQEGTSDDTFTVAIAKEAEGPEYSGGAHYHHKATLTFTADMVDAVDHTTPINSPTAIKIACTYNVLPLWQSVAPRQ